MARVGASQVELLESALLVEGAIEAYLFPKIVVSCESKEATGDELCFNDIRRLKN